MFGKSPSGPAGYSRKWQAVGAAIALIAPGLTATAQADVDPEARLSDANVALIYHQLSGEAAPVEEMMTDPLNMRFDNEFEKRRFVKEKFPEFEKMAADALSHDAYYVQFNTRLNDYDFDDEQFPVAGIYPRSMFFTFDADDAGSDGFDYAVQIVNSSDVKHLDIGPDEAEALMSKIGSGRNIRVRMWLVPVAPVEAGWAKLNDDMFRTFNTVATKVEIMDRDGNPLAEIDSGLDAKNKAKAVKDNPIKMPDFSNPWSAENRSEALLEYYDWVVTEKYKLSSSGEGTSFNEAMDLRGAVSSGCIAKFGYSECGRLATSRRQVVDQCASEMEGDKKRLCYKLQYVPYSSAEADAR